MDLGDDEKFIMQKFPTEVLNKATLDYFNKF